MADVKTLELLAARMKQDAMRGHGINPSALASAAAIIEDAIGAPLMWPTREAGAAFADEQYSGSPSFRAVFNHGVKWTVEQYGLDNAEFVRARAWHKNSEPPQ